MEPNADMMLVALGSGVTGMLIGAFLMFRGLHPQSRQQLESQLQEAEQKLKQQNAHIAEHFTHTASLVSNLTKNYRDLHDYLASSAQQLADIDVQPILLSDSNVTPILGQGIVINAPLDYAPKKDNNNIGTLSEAYGLKDDALSKKIGDNAYHDL